MDFAAQDLSDFTPEFFRGQNFLGRPTSITLGGAEPGAQAGTLDAGGGVPPGAPGPGGGGIPGAGPPTGATGAGGAGTPGGQRTIQIGDTPFPILSLLSAGSRIQDLISGLFGGGGNLAGTGLSGAGLGFSTSGLAEIGGGGLAEGPALATGFSVLGQAAPIWAGLTAAVDLLGEGKVPFQGLIDYFFPGTFGPSVDWMTFGPRLGQTLQATDAATTEFARTLVGAQGQDAVTQAVEAWKRAVGEVVPNFGAGTGPLDIPGLPGATGSRHEGRILADFAPTTAGLQALLQAALQGLSPEDRIAAFQAGAQPLLDERAAFMAQLQAAIDALNQEQGGIQYQGSP